MVEGRRKYRRRGRRKKERRRKSCVIAQRKRAICTKGRWTYRSRAPNNVRRLLNVPVLRGVTAQGRREKAKHGLSSGTTGGKPQFLGARKSRRTEEAHLVHTGCAARLSAWHLHFAARQPSQHSG